MQALKDFIKRYWGNIVFRRKLDPSCKIEMEQHTPADVKSIEDAAFDIFTDQGEDGIIHYLLGKMKDVEPFFLDIGSGDCINSNCATLAVHYSWKGVFIDRNPRKLAIGRNFYRKLNRDGRLRFIQTEVESREIENEILKMRISSQPGLLSIDIDGNDYWIWNAIDFIKPRLVVIEAKVEFGERKFIVPEMPKGTKVIDNRYTGASVEAIRLLGKKKGYKMVGANRHGYNLFFVRENEDINEMTTAEILSSPSVRASFYPEDFFRNRQQSMGKWQGNSKDV